MFEMHSVLKVTKANGELIGYRYSYYDALQLAGKDGLIEPVNADTEFNTNEQGDE